MKKPIMLIAVLLCMQMSTAQAPFYTTYDWVENPQYSIEPSFQEDILAIKDKIVTEFYFIDDNSLVEYFLEHRVLWLNSDDKIEEYNKIYLPYSATSDLEVSKARVITKNGQIVMLNDDKILTAEDEETGNRYKYFALEGVEKGSFIEYFYVVKKHPGYTGKRLSFQSDVQKKTVEFDLYSPSNLVFKFKSYNNFPEVELDTTSAEKLHWKLRMDTLGSVQEEDVSAYNASRGFFIYKLDRNLANNTNNITSYATVAQNIYNFYYPEYSKSTQKLIEKFIKEAHVNKTMEENELVRKLEFHIKNNVFLSDASSDELSNLDNVLQQKVGNETGIVKLYIALLRSLGVKHEIVLTSNRFDLRFDDSFEANNFLTDFLIYFPKNETYLSPKELESRYGFPPFGLTDNHGLFIKEVIVGDYKSGIGKISYIEPIGADKTFDTMVIDVAFDKDNLSKNIITLDRRLNGYYSMPIHPFLNLVKEEDKEEMIEGLAKTMSENIDIINKQLVNDDPELFGKMPLQFLVDIESEAFVEKAGNRYLFKVGELIGRQIEMYQEKERKLPVESDFERSYYRTINVTIPEGYKVANLEDINIDNAYVVNGKELLSFKSFFELDGNILKITADEHYRKNRISVENYEQYRAVINSAADFNKVSLVLEPVQ